MEFNMSRVFLHEALQNSTPKMILKSYTLDYGHISQEPRDKRSNLFPNTRIRMAHSLQISVHKRLYHGHLNYMYRLYNYIKSPGKQSQSNMS